MSRIPSRLSKGQSNLPKPKTSSQSSVSTKSSSTLVPSQSGSQKRGIPKPSTSTASCEPCTGTGNVPPSKTVGGARATTAPSGLRPPATTGEGRLHLGSGLRPPAAGGGGRLSLGTGVRPPGTAGQGRSSLGYGQPRRTTVTTGERSQAAGVRGELGSGLRSSAATGGGRLPLGTGLKPPATTVGGRPSLGSGLRPPATTVGRKPSLGSGLRPPATTVGRGPSLGSDLRPPAAAGGGRLSLGTGLRPPGTAGQGRSSFGYGQPRRTPATTGERSQAAAVSGRPSSIGGARSSIGAIPKITRTISSTSGVDSDGRRKTTTTIITKTLPKPSKLPPHGQRSIARPVVGVPYEQIVEDTFPYPCDATEGSPRKSPPKSKTPPSSPHETSLLKRAVQQKLLETSASSPGAPVRMKGEHRQSTRPPTIMTPEGPVQATQQISFEKSLIRSPRHEIVTKHTTRTQLDGTGHATKLDVDIQQLDPVLPSADPDAPPAEVISVSDTISVAPGYTQKVKTVVHEVSKVQGAIDPLQLSQMVEEERNDVEIALSMVPIELKDQSPKNYSLKKKIQTMNFNADSLAILEQSIVYPNPTGDEAQDEMQPEVIAAIMLTEEKGVTMGAPPSSVYNYLFPEIGDEPVIAISSAAPAPLQDAVIPTMVPSQLHTSIMGRELEQAAITSHGTPQKPSDSIYSETVGKKQGARVANTLKKRTVKKKKYPNLATEEPPWGVEDLQPIIEAVGATPAGDLTLLEAGLESDTDLQRDDDNGIEYLLIPKTPQHTSRVHLRGTQKPSWFPGYYVALPEIPEVIKLANSPSSVLHAAWKSVQPDIFPDESFYVVG